MCNFLDQRFHPYKFHGMDMSGMLFFIFASSESLTCLNRLLLFVICETQMADALIQIKSLYVSAADQDIVQMGETTILAVEITMIIIENRAEQM